MSEQKIAVITGASRGIGKAIALRLAGDGYKVIINYNGSEAAAIEVKNQIEQTGGQAETYQCNVAEFDSCQQFVEKVIEENGHIDVLVNNAGITKDGLLMRMSEEDFDRVIDTNLKGTFHMIRFASRYMLKQKKGHIINMASVVGVAGNAGQAKMVADIFGSGGQNDYYRTSLFLRTNGSATDIYLSDIGYEDSDEKHPISSAIRVGLVVHKAGKNQAIQGEYIFAISDKKNPQAEYNTATGREGYVLDCTRTDGSTVPFAPYTSDAYCIYNQNTGEVTLKNNSLKLCTISGNGDGQSGAPVEIELYIWLEGCDEDCTLNLCSQTLRNLAVSFAGTSSS